MVRVTVPVPGHPYDVTIGPGSSGRADEHLPALPGATTAFVVADRAVADLHHEPLAKALEASWSRLRAPPRPAGRGSQVAQGARERCCGSWRHARLIATTSILALGGGAVGDLAGFVAATYMRGIPFVQIPTTLTAQVDAAVGGKTAVNLPEGKNLVGTFAQPLAVLADVDVLSTLAERDFRSGLAEVAKYALTLDEKLLSLLENDPGPVVARDVVVMEDAGRPVRRGEGADRRRRTNGTPAPGWSSTTATRSVTRSSGSTRSGAEPTERRWLGDGLRRDDSRSREVSRPGLSARTIRLLRSLGAGA